jgi:hypothetical protein
MFVNFALFYLAVAAFYFLFFFCRAKLSAIFAAEQPDTPPPTCDIYFVVRIFMPNGKWGVILQAHENYYRLPMAKNMDPEACERYRSASLRIDSVDKKGKPIKILVFTAPDEFCIPGMMPKFGTVHIDAAHAVSLFINYKTQPHFSQASGRIMDTVQRTIAEYTGIADYRWFRGSL